jgi:DNA-binding transcriptional LysR family regulator
MSVVEEGTFTAAAARLYMVQSSLSSSLLSLERELGTELFIRGRRGAELTDAGRAFLEPARAALSHADRARHAVAEAKGLLRGSVRIAALAVPRSIDIVDAIRSFHEKHPGVDLRLVSAGARSMMELVTEGQVDFAVTPRTERIPPALRFESLISRQLAIVCPTGHRLAGAREVDPRDLDGEVIIDLTVVWRVRELFDQLLKSHDVPRQARFEVSDWLGALTLVQRGVGISYGPLECIDTDVFRGVAYATVSGAPLWELGIATRDEFLRGAAGRAFLTAYREHCLTTLGTSVEDPFCPGAVEPPAV